MPIVVLVAALLGFHGFRLVVNPGEMRLQAIHDA
jgi:hypothetical protein